MKQKILLLFTLFFIVSVSKAQDTQFWFVTNETGPSGNTLFNNGGFFFSNANEKDATITIHYYKTNLTQTIAVPAKSGYAHTLAATFIRTNFIATADGEVANCGVHISSTERVSAYFHWNLENYQYIAALKGQAALGYEFYVTQVSDRWANLDHTYDCINIVAPQDDTTIKFTPTRNCYGAGGNYTAGTTYTKTLNEGQTFSFRELNKDDGAGTFSSLAGTHITSDKPIAVTSTEGVNNDPAGDQLIPITRLGTDYVIVKGFGAFANSERTYITATEDNTKVYATPESGTETLLATLNAGKTTVYNMGNKDAAPYVLTIRADKPVSVMQYVDVNQLNGPYSHTDGAVVPDITNLSVGDYSFYNIYSAPDVYNAILTVYKKGSRNDFTITYNGNTYPIATSNAGTVIRYGDVPGYPNLEYMQWQLPTSSRGMLVNVNNSTSAYTLGYYSASLATLYTTFAYFSTFTGGDERDICLGGDIDPLTGFLPLVGTETYQWQSSINSNTWANIPGATSDTYTPSNSKRGITYYRITKVASGTITASGKPIKVRIRSCVMPVNHNISVMGYYD